MTSGGQVREWHPEEGSRVVDSESTPGGSTSTIGFDDADEDTRA